MECVGLVMPEGSPNPPSLRLNTLVALSWPEPCPQEVRAEPAPGSSLGGGGVRLVALTSWTRTHPGCAVNTRLQWGLKRSCLSLAELTWLRWGIAGAPGGCLAGRQWPLL